MTIVRLGADVVSSSPAARQFFFIYIYINDKGKEDLNIRQKERSKKMKFSRMEKMPTRPNQESNLGLQQMRLVRYQQFRGQAVGFGSERKRKRPKPCTSLWRSNGAGG